MAFVPCSALLGPARSCSELLGATLVPPIRVGYVTSMDDTSSAITQELRQTAVKLFTVIKEPNQYQPWDLSYQKTSGGSAFVVPGHRLLTNAHVVSHQVYIQAQKSDDSKKYTAKVEFVDHDSEIALLAVEDPAFFDGTIPVQFGELPSHQDKIVVYGYPLGGNDVCATAGVVSRIEVRRYTHSQRRLLALQTDAAINPGNSGGPVFVGERLVGLAFQSHRKRDLERSGYVVPIPVIKHFFEDLEDGRVGGVPDLGVYWQKIENQSLRDYVGLVADQTGVLVSRVVYGSSAWGALREGDVMTALDDAPIACDGSVQLRGRDRVEFTHFVNQRQVGSSIDVGVVREGRARRISVKLATLVSLVSPPRPDRRPTYFVFSGLVFMVLSYDYMATWDWNDISPRFRHYYYDQLPSERRREIVIVNQVLAHDINVGYHQLRGAVVERINGVDIASMSDVLRAVRTPSGRHHVIEIDSHGVAGDSSDYHSAYGTRVVLDAASAARATQEVLTQYGISSDRSADLL